MYLLRKMSRQGAVVHLERPIERPVVIAPPVVVPEKIKLIPMVMDTVVKIDSTVLTGQVVDARTRLPISDAEVTWKLLPARFPLGTSRTNRSGVYSLFLRTGSEYEVSAQSPRYFFDVAQLHTPPPTERIDTIVKNFALPETLSLRVNFPFNQADRPYEFTLGDDGLPSTLTAAEAINLLADNLKVTREKLKQLKLIGHTDSVGSDFYNERLGLRRAQYVKNQLVQRGVPAALITVESRGRTQPVARRPGESNDVFAARCRRTELAKVLEQ